MALGWLFLAAATVAPNISAARLSEDIKVLSSDAFEGRGPGTPGEQKTIDYLVSEFKKAGALPAGPDGQWTQPMQMSRHRLSEKKSVTAMGKSCSIDLSHDAIVWTRNPAPSVNIQNAPVVFAGYGVESERVGWHDFDGIDLGGKVVIVHTNDPDWRNESGPFGGKAMSYHARLSTKVDEAGRRGALAVLAVHDPDSTEYAFDYARELFRQPASGVVGSDASLVRFSGYLKKEVSEKLFVCAGRNLAADTKAAETHGFRPFAIDATISAHFEVQTEVLTTHNVVAKMVGRRNADEYFVYTAHWDHLGRGKPDKTGDDIYNGALDNAGGSAGLLELARAFGRSPKTERSILFIAMTLEESGLLGSEYYASHPTVPLAKMVGGFNMDAVNLFGLTNTMEVTSMGQNTLEDHLKAALAKQGRTMQDDPNSVVGFYFRSDHFPFAKRGVPFIFAGSGWDIAGQVMAKNMREPELGTRFHRPSDEWMPDLDFKAAARDIQLYYDVGRGLADSREWPRWKEGSDFAVVREKSADERR